MNEIRSSAPSAASSCSISGVWRWRGTPYALTFSSTLTKWVFSVAARPAPDTPDLASITTSPSSPARASGASDRIEAVG